MVKVAAITAASVGLIIAVAYLTLGRATSRWEVSWLL